MGVKTRQYAVYALLLASVAVLGPLLYRIAHPDRVLAFRAEESLSRGQVSAAVDFSRQAMERGHDPGALLRRLGPDALREPAMMPVFGEALAKDGGNLALGFALVESMALAGRIDQALILLGGLKDDGSHRRQLLSARARLLAWDGRFDEAITAYKQLLGEAQ